MFGLFHEGPYALRIAVGVEGLDHVDALGQLRNVYAPRVGISGYYGALQRLHGNVLGLTELAGNVEYAAVGRQRVGLVLSGL